MYALGHKQDICSAIRRVRFTPRKRTCAVHSPMSAGEDCANALAYLSADQQKAIAQASGSLRRSSKDSELQKGYRS